MKYFISYMFLSMVALNSFMKYKNYTVEIDERCHPNCTCHICARAFGTSCPSGK